MGEGGWARVGLGWAGEGKAVLVLGGWARVASVRAGEGWAALATAGKAAPGARVAAGKSEVCRSQGRHTYTKRKLRVRGSAT